MVPLSATVLVMGLFRENCGTGNSGGKPSLHETAASAMNKSKTSMALRVRMAYLLAVRL